MNTNCIQILNNRYLEESPCPRLFTYENQGPEPDRWYGILTLLSDTDLTGVWIRMVFDKPLLQLGNWFGEVKKRGEMDYLIRNPQFNLSAHTTKIVRFFVRYNVKEAPPQLLQFRINGRTVCPEEVTTTPSTTTLKLFTSEDENPDFVATAPSVTSVVIPQPTSKPSNIIYISPQPTARPLDAAFASIQATTRRTEFETERPPLISHANPNPPFHDVDENIDNICSTVMENNDSKQDTSGKQVVSKGQFPWHATMYYTKGVTIAYLCGASLISKYHLLTVAHCVINKLKPNVPLNPELIIVYLGKFNVKHWANSPTQTVYITDIITHPQFNAEAYSNDIAVLKLLFPAEITDIVRPVCLWQEPPSAYVANRQGIVVGWGFDSSGKIDDALMYVNMVIRSRDVCSASFENYTTRFPSDNVFCANFVEDTHECVGDSGGGMVVRGFGKKSKAVWQLKGLVTYSVVLQHKFKCDADSYAIFTDVSKYVDWIKQLIAT